MRYGKERMALDLKIVQNRIDNFYLNMTDIWTPKMFDEHDRIRNEYIAMRKEYLTKYGTEPRHSKCKNYDEVVNLLTKLEEGMAKA